MKFLHTADLHLGRRLNDIPLLEDQKKVMDQIADIAVKENVDAIIIAGDIYDKSMPGADAMRVFDMFISSLAENNINVFMISGNHDSSERISYFSDIIRKAGIYTSEAFEGKLQTVTVKDNYGDVKVHLMPFIRPLQIRRFYPEYEIVTYEDAVRTVLENSLINKDERNVLIAHQFITGAEVSDSEEFAVGGLDAISGSLFEAFDYVALGHLHKPQEVIRETMRYAGSPMKYSMSEAAHRKSVSIIDIKDKYSDIEIRQIELTAPHDVREVKGSLSEIMELPYSEDYVRVIITDEMVAPDARITVSAVFPNMISMSVINSRTLEEEGIYVSENIRDKDKMELFCDFYRMQNNGIDPEDVQIQIIKEILNELEEDAYETN